MIKLQEPHSTVLTHTPTRWVSLDAVLERMIKLREPHSTVLTHTPTRWVSLDAVLERMIKLQEPHSTVLTHTPTRWVSLDAVLERMIKLREPHSTVLTHTPTRWVSLDAVLERMIKLQEPHSTVLTHTPTRWVSLDAVLERMIKLREPLRAHFFSLKRPHIREFFKSETSLVIVRFLHSTLQLFKKLLLLLQKTNALFPELAEIIDSFRSKILHRQCSKFFGASTDDLLRTVDKENANVLKSSFHKFYTVTSEYIIKWCGLEKHLKYIN